MGEFLAFFDLDESWHPCRGDCDTMIGHDLTIVMPSTTQKMIHNVNSQSLVLDRELKRGQNCTHEEAPQSDDQHWAVIHPRFERHILVTKQIFLPQTEQAPYLCI